MVACLLLVAAPARAFDDPSQFFATVPGAATFGASAEGVYFTGAPRFASQSCESCHTNAPGKLGLRFGADDPTLFTVGYQPNTVYQLQVELVNESRGTLFSASTTCTEPPGPKDTYTYVQCNNNNFALEVDDLNQVPIAGQLCASKPTVSGGAVSCPPADGLNDQTMVAPDGTALFGNRTHDPKNPKTVTRNGAVAWDFYWVSPSSGGGPVTFHIGAVDGNGGGGTANDDQDPLNDDLVSAQFFVHEAGADAPDGSHAGCQTGGAPAGIPILLLVPLLALLARRRRSH